MNVLKKLNHVQEDSSTSKPYHGLPKLPVGYHEIVCFRESVGKFGRSVIAELDKQIIFLPKNMAEKLDENDIATLNSSAEKLFLFFGGKHIINK